ncbi:MAG: DUF6442 family protein [Acutalibacteraceae bacterium]
MNKYEILEKSRNENRNKDIVELEILRKSQRIGGIVALILVCILMFVEEFIFQKQKNFAYLAIIFSFIAGTFVYRAVKSKSKQDIVFAVLMSVCAAFEIAMYILNLCGV